MDDGRCEAWKDEVDNLLIFAGLFSGIATGFTLEAYTWLNADPTTATAQILSIMAQQQLSNNSLPTYQQQLSSIVSGLQNFAPPAYAIRVNVFWFLSLSFALTTATVGILCMQWLREYQRDNNLPHMETFALSQMRREGLEKWRVPTILSTLSLFLQLSLMLFFIGLLDFLWHISDATTAVAIVNSVFCGITLLFLAATTVLPSFQFLFHASYRLRVPQCPYKSPQAWAFCRLGFYLFSLLSYIMPDPKFTFDATANYVMSDWMQWRHRFARGKHALKFASWQHFDNYWYDSRVQQMHNDRPSELDSDFVDGLENLAETLVPESPVFYHLLQCMRNAPLETNKLGPALKRIFGDQHNRAYSALERLSIVQAKDSIGVLSLRYLPDPAARISPEAIKSYWELAIRINNTAADEDGLVEFLPPISLEHVKQVTIPEDIIYQAFTSIGRLARADRDLRYGIDNMFVLLVSALARMSLDQDNDNRPQLDGLMRAMFDTCEQIERWNRQRKLVDMRAVLKCASWISNAFASPVVDDEVVLRWKQHRDHAKLVSLILMLDSLWSEGNRKKPITNEQAWASVKRKLLTLDYQV
ncbi:hypothetical protein AX14_012177 [Amanita brunnescens Koide BX004]|nr:hypothetical protein AX14_012177 [Amanita brunnescens Koide BX004]